MSDDKSVDIDPRFDPAFQRGFDQSIPIDEFVPDPQPRKTATPAPVLAPVAEPKKVVVAPSPVAQIPESGAAVAEDDESSEAAVETVVETDADSSPSRNPFLLFLVIIAIALVAAGIWLFVRSGDAFNSREVRSQGDYMSLDATIHMAPFIALLGAATAIGVLFVFASKWKKRR
jgi:uncharacterized membrane protein YidH (DUF202 family)